MQQGGMGPFQPTISHAVRPSFGRSRQHDDAERDRIEQEVGQRFSALAPAQETPPEKLSRVERAMRRNAPDLAGGTPEEIAAARARRRAHHYAKWPRPRLAALLMLMMAGVLHPMSMLRLGVWGVVLFLALSIVVGPERARDYCKSIWVRFVGLWKHEIIVFRKALAVMMRWIEFWGRSAL